MEFKWENLIEKGGYRTWRAKVHNGWLVKTDTSNGVAMCFVPDPVHTWNIEKRDK